MEHKTGDTLNQALGLVEEIQGRTTGIPATMSDLLRAMQVIEFIRRNKELDDQWETYRKEDKAIRELQERVFELDTYRDSDRTQFNQLCKKHGALSSEMHARVRGVAKRIDALEGGMLELDGITDQVLDVKEKLADLQQRLTTIGLAQE